METRILGIDYGTSRIGLAVSDPLHIIATPLKTIKNKSVENLLEKIISVVKEFNINKIVLGFPLGMNGNETKQSESVRKFSKLLKNDKYEVILEDERLTSILAVKSLIKQNVKTGSNKPIIDRTAAALILQSYLDKQKLAKDC